MLLRRRTCLPALALALALPLTGCSDDGAADTAPTPAATAAASAAGGSGGSYASTAEIIAAIKAGGLACDDVQEGTYEGVAQAQGCILEQTEDVVVLRFATPQEKQGYLDGKDPLASVVVGEDWAVQTVLPQTAEKVAGVLGGELVAGQTS